VIPFLISLSEIPGDDLEFSIFFLIEEMSKKLPSLFRFFSPILLIAFETLVSPSLFSLHPSSRKSDRCTPPLFSFFQVLFFLSTRAGDGTPLVFLFFLQTRRSFPSFPLFQSSFLEGASTLVVPPPLFPFFPWQIEGEEVGSFPPL